MLAFISNLEGMTLPNYSQRGQFVVHPIGKTLTQDFLT